MEKGIESFALCIFPSIKYILIFKIFLKIFLILLMVHNDHDQFLFSLVKIIDFVFLDQVPDLVVFVRKAWRLRFSMVSVELLLMSHPQNMPVGSRSISFRIASKLAVGLTLRYGCHFEFRLG